MNWPILVWALMIGACLMVALINLLIWLRRHDAGHLHFLLVGIVAIAVCAFGYVEIRLMTSSTVSAWTAFARLAHVPVFVMAVGIALFVHVYMRTGRLWLLYAVVVSRVGVLVANFASDVNIHFQSVLSLETVSFLGAQVVVVRDSIPGPWARFAPFSTLLLFLYVADATMSLWRHGDQVLRRRALLVGSSCCMTILFSLGVSMVKHEAKLDWPYFVTPSFLFLMLAVAYELTTDVLRKDEIAADLDATRQALDASTKAAGVGVWDWNIASGEMHVSEQGLRLMGLPATSALSSSQFLDRLHSEDRKLVQTVVENAARSGSAFDVWARIAGADVRTRWIALRGRAEALGARAPTSVVRGVLLDVTDRQEADERVRAIAEASPIGVFMVNAAGVIVFANRRAESMFGYEAGELREQHLDHLVAEPFRQSHEARRQEFSQFVGARAMRDGRDVLGVRKDGASIVAEVWLATASIHGEQVVVANVIDNTWRRDAESELSRKRDELAHLSRVAMLGELSGALAHELNQPLTAVLSNAQACEQLVVQGRLGPDMLKEILGDIVSDTRRAGEVIRRLRALLRRGEVVSEPVDLSVTVLDVLRLMSSNLIDRRVSVSTIFAPDLPQVMADRVQMHQVVLNLLLNACEAMDGDDAPHLLLVRTEVAQDGYVRLSVIDEGPGVPPDALAHVFEPFFTTKAQGLGLGLSVCQSIIKHHGGYIGAENNATRGAVFYFGLRPVPKSD